MANRTSLAPGLALALVSSGAMAETAKQQAAKQKETRAFAKACGGDIKRLCPGVPPGEGRIKACMKAHADKLSRPCFDAILGAAASQ